MATPYDRRFYRELESPSYRSAAIVVPILTQMFGPKSVIDFGCGIGTWLKAFRESGVDDIFGVDGKYAEDAGLLIPAQYFQPVDLTLPYKSSRKYDLAICLEVAEHLPAQAAETLVQGLCGCTDIVIFSAAVPHQRGTHHINCQWQSHWAAIFAAQGFDCFDLVRPKIWGNDDICFWYQQNLIVYIRASSPLAAGKVPARAASLDSVHPQLYLSAALDWVRLKTYAQKIPKKLGSILRARLP